MQTNSLTVAVVQHACHENREHNIECTTTLVAKAAAQKAKLVLLPELHTSQYFCQTANPTYFQLAEPIPGPTTHHFAKLAKQLQCVIVASVFEERLPGLYHNTAVILDTDGEIAGCYRKMHIPDDPGFYEKYYFTPGDQGFKPIQTSIGKLGVLVCWDQWFPEAARLMTLAGSEILLYPSAIGWDPNDDLLTQQQQLDAWITIQRGHAIANALPVITSNRIGRQQLDAQSTTDFWGNSFITGPQGEILAQATRNEEQVIVTTLDLTRTRHIRQIWPFLRDRRIDAYADLTTRITPCYK